MPGGAGFLRDGTGVILIFARLPPAQQRFKMNRPWGVGRTGAGNRMGGIMTRRFGWLAGIALAAGFALPLAVEGAAQRTFVGSTGVDTNACTIAAPCRSLMQAATQTSSNGEIVVLDSADYGPVSITESLSIIAPPGVHAGMSVRTGNGIVVTGPTIRVVLRGLAINGHGAGGYGIVVNDSAYVHIENVIVSGMVNSGILVNGQSRVFINDTLLRNNGGSGLEIKPFGDGFAEVSVDRLRSEANHDDGIYVDNNVVLNIRDSVTTRNFGSGISVFPDIGETVSVGIDNTAMTNNENHGLAVQGTGVGAVVVANNVVKDNFGGGLLRAAAGITVYTRQNNTIVQNASFDVSGALTPVGGQ